MCHHYVTDEPTEEELLEADEEKELLEADDEEHVDREAPEAPADD